MLTEFAIIERRIPAPLCNSVNPSRRKTELSNTFNLRVRAPVSEKNPVVRSAARRMRYANRVARPPKSFHVQTMMPDGSPPGVDAKNNHQGRVRVWESMCC